jgi:hypothetical protein
MKKNSHDYIIKIVKELPAGHFLCKEAGNSPVFAQAPLIEEPHSTDHQPADVDEFFGEVTAQDIKDIKSSFDFFLQGGGPVAMIRELLSDGYEQVAFGGSDWFDIKALMLHAIWSQIWPPESFHLRGRRGRSRPRPLG